MLDNDWASYLSIRAVIIFFHYVGPACALYTCSVVLRSLQIGSWPVLTLLRAWAAAETLCFGFLLWYRTRLQHEAVHPPLRSEEERVAFFKTVKAEIHDMTAFISGWFRGAKMDDIGRDDLKLFLSWAFFEGRAEDGDELEDMTRQVEELIGHDFKPGAGPAKGLRLTIDPIEAQWRSLVWYAIILGVDTVTHIRLRIYGFEFHGTRSTSLAIFPPRPAAVLDATATSPAPDMSYWLRPHTSKTRLPVLWIHGIGVGLHPNVEFMHELDVALNKGSSDKDQVGILSLEILQISTRLTAPILTRPEFLRQLSIVLEHLKYDRFVLVSHSYGSTMSTHILTDPTLSHRVAATLLVDPVTLLLHMPDVAYNFTVRTPASASEWELWYFASKDPGVAYTLGRHFFWSDNVLWRERIVELMVKNGMRFTASLAGRDLIVDTQAVGAYLVGRKRCDTVVVADAEKIKHMELKVDGADNAEEAWKTWKRKGEGLEVMWWEGLDHAQVFDTEARRIKLIEVLVAYSNGR